MRPRQRITVSRHQRVLLRPYRRRTTMATPRPWLLRHRHHPYRKHHRHYRYRRNRLRAETQPVTLGTVGAAAEATIRKRVNISTTSDHRRWTTPRPVPALSGAHPSNLILLNQRGLKCRIRGQAMTDPPWRRAHRPRVSSL